MDESKITEILNSPLLKSIIEKLTKLTENKDLVEKGTDIFSNIDFKELLYVQLGVILFMMILRSYLFSKVSSFLAHFFAEIWTFAIFLSLSLFFVPLYVVGFEYLDIIKSIFKLLT